MNARFSRLTFVAAFAVVVLATRSGDANAPAGHYTIGAGPTAGTVYDNKSKLTWQQMVQSTQYGQASQAASYCSTLALNGTGWRLPTAKELFSLFDFTQQTTPYVDPTAFPNTPTSGFMWTATVGWFVNLTGAPSFISAGSVTAPVRCVR